MQGNPYQRMIDTIRKQQKATAIYRIGIVKETSPLSVEVAGTLQVGNLSINPSLTWGIITYSAIDHILGLGDDEVTPTEEAYPDVGLAIGDEILLMSTDDQSFIVICKVVPA